ncbi:hypothetical protein QYN14_05365 [Rhodococcus ruber]|uniref:hypothetical protein n=1 Tax=Rhodococcus ruber TaxID=1830 RepID=UPI00177B3E72|nr:hypothetical protein [Rhodococcus ruber]WKK13026.1 hypothetical protein QYN14_05365 [Rhodococcus ruber]
MTPPAHIVVARARSKRPPIRCRDSRCAQLTRHRTGRCAAHRGQHHHRQRRIRTRTVEPITLLDLETREDRP